MPAIVYLSEDKVVAGRRIDGDEDANGLLQQLRNKTGRDWIVLVHVQVGRRPLFGSYPTTRHYDLCLPCGGEWQVLNLCTKSGGSLYDDDGNSREHVMNYMLGLLAGLEG
ncbi:hypothetical protein AWH62_00940 [Maricaulis sp. W15]|uniref:hypothetical protein n=1 Tax=Maricaulis sp. W15 TaxID=1772333 RepID=UPI000948B766|nr:hypothetical protein [Maricaulis sp. W15]OLF81272.1 hypothetical protein AWH62_00940 [Maricaulis sp. W15]